MYTYVVGGVDLGLLGVVAAPALAPAAVVCRLIRVAPLRVLLRLHSAVLEPDLRDGTITWLAKLASYLVDVNCQHSVFHPRCLCTIP